ncbi:MAG: DUF4250 domain-containing protein [Paludibacteraceae bacterium]|nr:DUF4250 domain-containing protein [Paludibacteraceae bacterium]
MPQDPFLLLSFINMKLRDEYSSLAELCEDMDIDQEALIKKLSDAGFVYSGANNKFW